MASDSNLPCLVFPYQRVPGLRYTPMGGFPHAMPASPNRKTLGVLGPELWKKRGSWLAEPGHVVGVATSRARDSFFALRFIDLLLTEMRIHGNRGLLEFRHDGEENA